MKLAFNSSAVKARTTSRWRRSGSSPATYFVVRACLRASLRISDLQCPRRSVQCLRGHPRPVLAVHIARRSQHLQRNEQAAHVFHYKVLNRSRSCCKSRRVRAQAVLRHAGRTVHDQVLRADMTPHSPLAVHSGTRVRSWPSFEDVFWPPPQLRSPQHKTMTRRPRVGG